MTTTPAASYKGHRFPAEIISHAVWRYFRFPRSYRLPPEHLVNDLATKILGGTLMFALRQAGWQIEWLPSGHVICQQGAETCEPFTLIQHLRLGLLDAEVWKRRFIAARISEIDLGRVLGPLALSVVP